MRVRNRQCERIIKTYPEKQVYTQAYILAYILAYTQAYKQAYTKACIAGIHRNYKQISTTEQ